MGIYPEGHNPKDPLIKTGPEAQMELTKLFGKAGTGFPNEVVLGAAINVFVNALRQTYPRASEAEARYNELVGRFKTVLLSHYDSVTGKRRSVFPFHQTISPSLHVDEDKIHRPKSN